MCIDYMVKLFSKCEIGGRNNEDCRKRIAFSLYVIYLKG